MPFIDGRSCASSESASTNSSKGNSSSFSLIKYYKHDYIREGSFWFIAGRFWRKIPWMWWINATYRGSWRSSRARVRRGVGRSSRWVGRWRFLRRLGWGSSGTRPPVACSCSFARVSAWGLRCCGWKIAWASASCFRCFWALTSSQVSRAPVYPAAATGRSSIIRPRSWPEIQRFLVWAPRTKASNSWHCTPSTRWCSPWLVRYWPALNWRFPWS